MAVEALYSLSPDEVIKLNFAFALVFVLTVFLALQLSEERPAWKRAMAGIAFLVTSSALGIDLGVALTATGTWGWSSLVFAAVWGFAGGATLRALNALHSP